MIPAATQAYLRNIAGHAAISILGDANGPRQNFLSDTIFEALCEAVDEGEARGLASTMVQLSIVPDGARVVG